MKFDFGKVQFGETRLKKLDDGYNHLCRKLPTTSFKASSFVGNNVGLPSASASEGLQVSFSLCFCSCVLSTLNNLRIT